MPAQKIETGHNDTIHDVAMDYYGKRVASTSSDSTIKITGVSNNGSSQHLATLIGHQGPVWQAAWAHPKFGSILASCSYDGKVILWKEGNQNEWTQSHIFNDHKSSVNSIAWAPHELGLCLACGSSDGNISVFTARSDGGWDTTRIDQAHPVGVTSVSWAPSMAPGALVGSGMLDPVQKLVSGGCDNTLRVWLNSTFPQLDDVILDFTPAQVFQNVSQVKKLIMGLTYVNVLTVTSTFLEGLSPNFVTGKLREPQFCLWYLKEFHLSIGTSFINPCDIASFLKNCPNLERIFIDLGESSFEWGYLWEVQARERFEQCNPSLQSLKVVKVTGFKFKKLELELVMFILKKARNLEMLALVSSRNNQPKVNSQDARLFYFQIIACRRSPNARVEMFEYLDDKSLIHPKHPRVGRKFLRGRALDD